MPSWQFFVRAGSWFLLLTLPVYAAGIFQSNMLTPRATSEICGPKAMAYPPVQESLIPLSHRCLWLDGTSTEKVPGAINPLLLLLVSVAATLFLLGIWALLRARPLNPERTSIG